MAAALRERGHRADRLVWELTPGILGSSPARWGWLLPPQQCGFTPWSRLFKLACLFSSSFPCAFPFFCIRTGAPSGRRGSCFLVGYLLVRRFHSVRLGLNPGPALTIHAPLGKALLLFAPQFPGLLNGNHSSMYLRGWWLGRCNKSVNV